MELLAPVDKLFKDFDDATALPISEVIGQPLDQCRLIMIFFLQFPIGWIFFYCVKGVTMRHIWNVVLGLLLQYYAFGTGVVHVFLMTTVAYLLMILLPRSVSGRYVMIWCLGYLCYNHLYRLIYMFGEFNMDISTFTMLHVCKLSALGYCYHDGAKAEDFLRPGQKERMVKDLPTVLEMAGYTWFVPQCTLGVFFEFSDYKNFIEKKKEYANIPSPILVSLQTLLEAIACMGFFLYMNNHFWLEYIYTQSEYGPCSFQYKVYYFFVAMTVKRFFYYGPFKFTTGAFQATGLGYNGPNKKEVGKHNWDKVVGVYVIEIETATSVTVMLRAWNHQVHLWLKFYILARIQKGDRASFMESMSTFVVSAFWHGFYPSYYLMFVMAAFLQEINKDVYKSWALWYKMIPTAELRFVLAYFFCFLNMNFFGILFSGLTMENSMFFLSTTYYFIPISLLVTLVGMRSMNIVGMGKRIEKKMSENKLE